jgi:hypothetical protein
VGNNCTKKQTFKHNAFVSSEQGFYLKQNMAANGIEKVKTQMSPNKN